MTDLNTLIRYLEQDAERQLNRVEAMLSTDLPVLESKVDQLQGYIEAQLDILRFIQTGSINPDSIAKEEN